MARGRRGVKGSVVRKCVSAITALAVAATLSANGVGDARAQSIQAQEAQTQGAQLPMSSGSSLPGLPRLADLAQLSSALPNPAANPAANPGTDTVGQVNGREYLLWVPASYNPATPMPLVVAYSALDNSAEAFREYSRLRESRMGREAIIVYPRAVGLSWEGMPTAKTGPGEDIAYIRALTAELQRQYTIDRGRIYATGMSQGGGMAAISACHMSDIFAAVASVSGAFYAPVNMGCANAPVAFLDIHGMADPVTPYYGGERWGAPILSVQTMFASYERRNACAGGVDRRPAAVNATRIAARGCAKPVEVIQVHGGGHSWFTLPSAADEVWAFLARQRK